MPCAVCERWVDPEIRMVALQWSGDMIVGLALSGERVVSVGGLSHQSSYRDLRRCLAYELRAHIPQRVSFYKRDEALEGELELGDMLIGDLEHVVAKVVVTSGWLRWRLCQCEPPPDWRRRVTIWKSEEPEELLRQPQQWFFICEECERRNQGLYFVSYKYVNFDGNLSSGSGEDV